MPAIVIEQAEIRLTVDQLVSALKQLAPEEREQVRLALAPVSWETRLEGLLQQVRERGRKYAVDENEITAEVEAVRAARSSGYDTSRH